MSTLTELFDSISKKIHDNKKLDYYIPLVNEYIGTDWKKYVSFSDIKYKKNLVKRNENLEMLIICWNNNQTSGIHDHPPNGCILKILDGELEENEYINNIFYEDIYHIKSENNIIEELLDKLIVF